MKKSTLFLINILVIFFNHLPAQDTLRTEILVVGGGVGGTAAGIQAARLGRQVILTEATTWLGGMLTAAGVSAVDGNHNLPSGIWAEFRQALYTTYGGEKKVSTGWVSNTLFEPHIGDSIFKSWAKQLPSLSILYNQIPTAVFKNNNKLSGVAVRNKITHKTTFILAQQIIDATELGDLLEMAKVPYSIGMEANSVTGENIPVAETNNIIQDLTYVAILKNYGAMADCTISKPIGYNPAEFDGSCTNYYKNTTRKAPGVDAIKMLNYGKLPNNKFMLNWPIFGNDTYLNVIQLSDSARTKALEEAQQTTLRFVYFIQHELGFKNLGLADDEFPTENRLALIPYHREGRRVEGLVRLKIQHIATPFATQDALYRTGIAVGDYPVDHHHKKNPTAPQHLDFYPVPSFNVPLGALIPKNISGLIVAEKAISVSNLANGTTRLQPCVLLTGQAAGALAALAVEMNKNNAADVPVRKVQSTLLQQGAYLMPYIDVPILHPQFAAVQRIGATGILRGTGKPSGWANQTWFYPDSLVKSSILAENIQPFLKNQPTKFSREYVNIDEVINLIIAFSSQYQFSNLSWNFNNKEILIQQLSVAWIEWGFGKLQLNAYIKRKEFAYLFDKTIDPFTLFAVSHQGKLISLSN
jgi:hypothetical protein